MRCVRCVYLTHCSEAGGSGQPTGSLQCVCVIPCLRDVDLQSERLQRSGSMFWTAMPG